MQYSVGLIHLLSPDRSCQLNRLLHKCNNLVTIECDSPTVVSDFTRLLSWQPVGGDCMSKQAAEHHHKAAEHHEHAARHHKEAAKHHEAGKHEMAANHAHLAHGHHEHAIHHAAEAVKAHLEHYGKTMLARS